MMMDDTPPSFGCIPHSLPYPEVYGAVSSDQWGQKRIGDWIQTFTGKKFRLLDPRPEDFCIEDIAHALSHICRFTGHVSKFYSVAEHSCRVCDDLAKECYSREIRYTGLMHDSAEAYISDMARPFKQLSEFAFYRNIEDELMRHLAGALQFVNPMPLCVKRSDEVLLGTEARDLMGNPVDGWHFRYHHLPEKIRPWSPRKAKREFLKRYYKFNPFGHKPSWRFRLLWWL